MASQQREWLGVWDTLFLSLQTSTWWTGHGIPSHSRVVAAAVGFFPSPEDVFLPGGGEGDKSPVSQSCAPDAVVTDRPVSDMLLVRAGGDRKRLRR